MDEDNRKVALKVWRKETVSNEQLKKLKFELEVALWMQDEIKQLIAELNREKKPEEIEGDADYNADTVHRECKLPFGGRVWRHRWHYQLDIWRG